MMTDWRFGDETGVRDVEVYVDACVERALLGARSAISLKTACPAQTQKAKTGSGENRELNKGRFELGATLTC
jgi:hypothetical protein